MHLPIKMAIIDRIIFIFILIHLIFPSIAFGSATTYPTDFQNDEEIKAFFCGLTCLNSGDIDEAIRHFSHCSDPFYLGLCYFEKGDFGKAKYYFSSNSNPPSAFYLARTLIKEGCFSQAEKILICTFEPFEENYYEQWFLKGELYFKQNLFGMAADSFEKALPAPKAEWYSDALYYLGWSYFKLSQQKIVQNQNYLEKAQNCFKDLLQNRPSEAALFALCQSNTKDAALLLNKHAHLLSEKGLELAKLFTLSEREHCFSSNGWILCALNHFEKKELNEAQQALDRAFQLERSADILRWKGVVALHQKSETELNRIKRMADSCNKEVYFLIGLVSAKLMQSENNLRFGEIALAALQQAEQNEQTLHLMGLVYYLSSRFQEALTFFTALIDKFPNSPLAGESLYWSARCQNDPKHFKGVYERYPESKYASDAYFQLYSYQEYMQGGVEAIRHLQSFTEKYPNHPLALNAFYLIGIDFTRDRKSPEGKAIKKKNYHEAISCFEKLEKTYQKMENGNRALYHQALLERSGVYLKMAHESQGAKKQLCLQYAEETLRRLLKEPLTTALKEESFFQLAKTLALAQQDRTAQAVLTQLISDTEQPKSYFLSKAWFELGMIALRRADFEEALNDLIAAEQTAQGLAADERLLLLIEQSHCYKMLNNLDQAMLTLSKVINDNAISGLRLKAMYLRSEIYEQQGRFELARKQLEATARKGGEWGVTARTKLEKDYGY